jgi:hypothetical protein
MQAGEQQQVAVGIGDDPPRHDARREPHLLRDHGVQVPAQMSVVGFNDVVAADMLQPPLTTVRIPQRELGRRAGELILELMAGEGDRYPSEPVRLPCELVVRGSTAPPPDVPAIDVVVRHSYGSPA